MHSAAHAQSLRKLLWKLGAPGPGVMDLLENIVREFLYVEDAAEGILLATDKSA
jgi:hypothetical protein